MIIYKAEAHLRDQILNERSFSFASEVSPAIAIPKKALATFNTKTPDTEDLFYTRSILVSTVWNKNDDVFDPLETWAARNTPVDKPTNLEHDCNQIVGHITSNWAISETGELLSDDLVAEEIPKFFHICNGAVIYLARSGEIKESVAKLIEDIKAGRKFVSMECYFKDFDYAARAGDEYHIIQRNQDTSFLTQHLRIYGGSGMFEGYEIGRLIKNITFCGKGYVDKPANPDSIIFTESDANKFSFAKILKTSDFSEKIGVYIKCNANSKEEIDDMPAENLEKQVSELQETVESLEQAGKAALADAEKNQGTIDELKAELETVKQALTEAEEAKSSVDQELETVTADRDEIAKQLKEMQDAQARLARVSVLTDGGVPREEAEAKVDEFAELSDPMFEQMAKLYIEAKVSKKKTDEVLVADEEVEETEEETEAAEVSETDEETETVEANVDTVDDNDDLRALIASKFNEKFGVKENK